MKISFAKKDTKAILADIQAQLAGRQLGEIVAIGAEGTDLVVTISKFGKSTLSFACTETASGLEYNLKEEKIAFAHRPFKGEVVEKFCKIVEKAGGKVLS